MGYFQMTRNVEELFGGVVTAPHQIPFTYKSNVGGETFLSLPFYPVTGVVTINGGMQVPLDNFEIEGNTLNLGRALSKGDVVYCLFDKILSPEDTAKGIRIYKFQAVGGETEFTPDFTSYGVQSLYIGGEYKTPEIEYSYDSTTGKVSLQTALTAGVWVVAEMSVKQPNISPAFDRSIQEIARSANVKDSEVIVSTDTISLLDGKKVVYDIAAQTSYGLPTLPSNVYISSVGNGQLTYNPGSITVSLVEVPNSAAKLKSELNTNIGSSMVRTSSGGTVEESLVKLKDSSQLVTPEQFYEQFPGETDWAVIINAAYTYARANNKSVLLANDYPIKSTIVHMDGLNVICTGRIIASPTGTYSYTTALNNEEGAAYVITTEDGVFNNAKSASIRGLLLTYTSNREPSGYTDTHISSKGVVVTDISNVYMDNIQTFGFLEGGIDIGGISGNGYEIVINKCLSWIYSWTDSEKSGFRCNVTDSTFYDVVTVAYGVGINNVKGGGNVYINPHPWGYPLTTGNTYPNRQCKILFNLIGGGSTFIRPYADTITKLDSSQPASRTNGGIGFYINNWRNKIIAAEAAIHTDDINTNMSLVYLVGDSARNEIEFTNVSNTSKLGNERVSYDSGYPNALFTNIVRVPEYNAGGLSNLTGSVTLTGSGITSTGTYSLRRDGEYIDILITINVSGVSSPTGPISVTLPRGLICRYGPCVEPNQSSCFGSINSSNIGTVAVLNGSTVNFYYKLANGTRTEINAPGVTAGALEFFIRGKISN
ncbi:tail fibers protein [Salmonella phage vB_SenAc-pSC20]|nr:tail fibers protein [Salmonella phage vB_SenAc-pSC20]